MATNVKLGVEVSEFKKGMKEAEDSVRLVNAMLKQNEAQLKLTGDAESTMEAQTSLLTAKLEAQKKAVEQAEKALQAMKDSGVDPTSKAYKDMMLKMVNAQTAAKNTEAELKTLSDTTEKAAGNTKSLGDGLKEIGQKISLDQAITGIEKITGAMEKGAKAAYKLGKSIVKQVLGAGSWADELQTTAKAYGITPEELQRMEKTAEIIDTSVDDILKSKQKMAKNTDKLSDLLGIEVGGKSVDDVFWETGEAIMALGDAFEQEEVAQKIFGKSWRDLVPLFSAGREEYERINSTWNVVSDEQLDALQKLDDQYQTLKADLETLKMETLSQLAEPMANVLQKLNEFISSDEGQKVIGDLMGTLKDALMWITDNSGAVVTALTTIGSAFGLMKVSEGVLTVVKLFDGFKGLLGGGKGGGNGTGTGGTTGTTTTTGGTTTGTSRTPNVTFDTKPGQAMMTSAVLNETYEIMEEAQEAAEKAGDDTLAFMHNMSQIAYEKGRITKEELEKRNKLDEELFGGMTGKNEPEVTVEVVPEPDAAEKLSSQVENVFIPAQLVVSGIVWGGGGSSGLKNSAFPNLRLGWGSGTEHDPLMALTGYANGLPYVPYDGYLARLHKGERVVPARQAGSSFSSNLYVENMNMSGGLSADALAASIASRNRRIMAGYGS